MSVRTDEAVNFATAGRAGSVSDPAQASGVADDWTP